MTNLSLLLLLLLSLSTLSSSLTSDLSLVSFPFSDSDSSQLLEPSELDDPTTRRFLAGGQRGYISYAALRRDSVPCSRRGASYYNCRPGAQANPYSRGCSRITRCRN